MDVFRMVTMTMLNNESDGFYFLDDFDCLGLVELEPFCLGDSHLLLIHLPQVAHLTKFIS